MTSFNTIYYTIVMNVFKYPIGVILGIKKWQYIRNHLTYKIQNRVQIRHKLWHTKWLIRKNQFPKSRCQLDVKGVPIGLGPHPLGHKFEFLEHKLALIMFRSLYLEFGCYFDLYARATLNGLPERKILVIDTVSQNR